MFIQYNNLDINFTIGAPGSARLTSLTSTCTASFPATATGTTAMRSTMWHPAADT